MPLYSNYTIILIEIFFQNTNVAFIKASVIDRRNEEMKTAYYNKEFCAAKFLWKDTVPGNCGNCAFPQSFQTRKLGEITGFFAVLSIITLMVDHKKIK